MPDDEPALSPSHGAWSYPRRLLGVAEVVPGQHRQIDTVVILVWVLVELADLPLHGQQGLPGGAPLLQDAAGHEWHGGHDARSPIVNAPYAATSSQFGREKEYGATDNRTTVRRL